MVVFLLQTPNLNDPSLENFVKNLERLRQRGELTEDAVAEMKAKLYPNSANQTKIRTTKQPQVCLMAKTIQDRTHLILGLLKNRKATAAAILARGHIGLMYV